MVGTKLKQDPKQIKCSNPKTSHKVSIIYEKKASLIDRKPSAAIREMMEAKRKEIALAQTKLSPPNNVPSKLISLSPPSNERPFISKARSPTTTPGEKSKLSREKLFGDGFSALKVPYHANACHVHATNYKTLKLNQFQLHLQQLPLPLK